MDAETENPFPTRSGENRSVECREWPEYSAGESEREARLSAPRSEDAMEALRIMVVCRERN